MATSGFADRAEVIQALADAFAAGQRPTVFAIAVHGLEELRAEDPEGTEAALGEARVRLTRLTRGSDLLGWLRPGVLALVVPVIDRGADAVLVQRVTGVFALPFQFGDDAVSLPVSCGVAHSGERQGSGSRHVETAESLVGRAEDDLARVLDAR